MALSRKNESAHDSKIKVHNLAMHADMSMSYGEEDTGLVAITYIAQLAGLMELHLW